VKPRPELPGGPYLIVGLARSGVAAALALRARAEQVIGVDAGTPPGAANLREAGVDVHLGEPDGAEYLDGVRAVIKSPGVPSGAPLIRAARGRGIPVLGELELAWRMLANEFIAVTGTNGKTTTVELVGHIHRRAGLAVAVAGNVGTAVSSLAGSLRADAVIVCEASSFQLEDTLAFAPEAAVLLNITPDHIDRHGTFEAYRAAKLLVFAHQDPGDIAVLPSALAPVIEDDARSRVEFGRDPEATMCEREGVLVWRGEPLMAVGEIALLGAHNVENAMAAAAVCLARGLSSEDVRDALATFPGVPHRLEVLATVDGVLYVNDSKATNVASTLVALEAFAGRRLHLIAGGQGKGQDFSALAEAVGQRCAGVYLIGEDAPAIAGALGAVATPILDCAELDRALGKARQAASAGDVVLLSPASASFDQFGDFEARGERFRELVREMEA
jgi:UDP-N-acetylmuramoylalanine--D-glutamate ligase